MKTTLMIFLFVLLVLPGVADAIQCYECIATSANDAYGGSEDCWNDDQVIANVTAVECEGDTTCLKRQYTANYTDSAGVMTEALSLERACQHAFNPDAFYLGCADLEFIDEQLPLEDFTQYIMSKYHTSDIRDFKITSFEECHCNVDECNLDEFVYGSATLPPTTTTSGAAGSTTTPSGTTSRVGATTTMAGDRSSPRVAASSTDDDDGSKMPIIIGAFVVLSLLVVGAALYILRERRKRKQAETRNPTERRDTQVSQASTTSGQSAISDISPESAQSGQSGQ